MEGQNYRNIANSLGARRSLGQNFLVSEDIAAMEAEYAKGMNVVELGPGLGILTRALCKTAKRVIAIEKDERLFGILEKGISSRKLMLIRNDFFLVDSKELRDIDIMVSNIPYNLSSKVIYWLGTMRIPALICVQKEFARHMLAEPSSRDYSKLSVVSHLCFRAHLVKDVSAGNFYPVPRVDSCIIYLAPRHNALDRKTIDTISLIMNHKKKRLKNAIVDSAKGFGVTKERAKSIACELEDAEERPFTLHPERILEIAKSVNSSLKAQKE